jgi:ATP-binding cassette subfamily C protein CydD
MRPLDPRLLRYASAARSTLAAGALLGLLQTGCVIGFSWVVTQLVVRAIAGEGIVALSGLFAALVVVVLLRGAISLLADANSARGGAMVISQLRQALTGAIGRLGPSWLSTRSTADVTLTVGRGLDALDGYFTKYLPQLILTAIATPVLLLVIFSQDATSGIIVLITLPLIPLFMVLVGWATQAAQERQWDALSTLSRGFLDVVAGLSTLKLFGRQHRQSEHIRSVSDDYRLRTMKVLRMSFLSGFVLEVAASLSVALVAVAIGLRLLNGQLDLSIGLFVLLLAPEAFLPLRNVGASYHAAAEGIEASQSAFAILDEDLAQVVAPGSSMEVAGTVPDGLVFDDVIVRYGDRTVVAGFSGSASPGRVTVLSAPSGAGKTSLVSAVLGFVPFEGRINAAGVVTAEARRSMIAWAGQRPGLIAGTVGENVALGAARPDALLIAAALREAAAPEISPDVMLGVGGAGISGGQAQRVALARAIYRMRAENCPVLILDEPTSALDDATEARVVACLRSIAAGGTAVLAISHRAAVVAAADDVLSMEALTYVR